MREKLGVPKDEVTSLCLSAYTNFGTTMAGLVVSSILCCVARLLFTDILPDFKTCTAVQATGYQIDVDDWHAHVHHTLPYEKYLKKDDALRNLLQRIKLPLYVFTNGDRKHAEICLRLMGITDCFKVHNPAFSDALYAAAQKYASLTALQTEAPAPISCATCVLAESVMTIDLCLQCCMVTGRSLLREHHGCS